MNTRFFVFSIILLALMSVSVFAHQPRIVEGAETVYVQNQEVSQAFYGNLNGTPQKFVINSNVSFQFYAGILVPDVKGIQKDVSANIIYDGKVQYVLKGQKSNWSYFYEEFAGDAYFWGPEYRANFSPGTYYITVFSPDNVGKYVLVVGEAEEFPPNEMWNALIIIPQLKVNFFEKQIWAVFEGKIGSYLLYLLIFIVIIIFLAWFLFKKIRKKNKAKKKK